MSQSEINTAGGAFDPLSLDQDMLGQFMDLKNNFDFALQTKGAEQLDPFMQALMEMTGMDDAESQQGDQMAQNGQPQQTLNDFTQQMMDPNYQALWG